MDVIVNGLHVNRMPAAPDDPRRSSLDKLVWGLLFIWIGAAFLADVGWPVGVLGVGIIALGAQAARIYMGLRVEVFGLAVGMAMLVWGGWHVFEARFGLLPIPGSLIPVVFIALGVALVLRALFRRDRTQGKS